ncbi:MAG: PepSY-associated TM helix domain-containing protein [Pseudomonadota bacterium]
MSPVPGSTFRRMLFWTHLGCGVTAGVLIVLMSVTGVLLTYERQIVDGVGKRNRVDPMPGTGHLDADTLAVRARAAVPADARASLVFDADPSRLVVVQAGRDASILLNPFTGAVTPDLTRPWRDFFRAVEDWHRWMGGDPRSTRANLMDVANLLFLFIIASGIYLWLPAVWRWRTLRGLMLFRTRYVNSKVRDFNWHHVFSFWMLAPLFLIALSGVVMSYGWANNLVYAAFGESTPQRGGPPGPGGGGGPARAPRPLAPDADASRASLQTILTVASGQVPNWRRITIPLTGASGTVDIAIELQSKELRPPRQTLTLAARDASVVRLTPPPAPGANAQTRGQRARTWFRFIHTGEQYGLIGQTLAGIASLAACFLAYTGLALAWRRLIHPLLRRAV